MNRYMRETLRNSGQPIVQSLKQLCLRCVVDNFERFMLAYDDSDIPPRNFEFLQRTLSKEMLQMLTEASTLKEKYFTFLINPYLKELDLQSFSFSDPEPILERLREVGKNITSLSLNGKPWDEKKLTEFVSLVPNVHTLLLQSTNCSCVLLKMISEECQSIKVLDLSFCTCVTDEGIIVYLGEANMKENVTLESLNLIATNVTCAGVTSALKYIPSLKTLQHDHVAEIIYVEHAADFASNTNVTQYNLTSLDIFAVESRSFFMAQPLANIVKICAAFCPHVTSLKIEGEIDQSVVNECIAFKAINDVKLCAILAPSAVMLSTTVLLTEFLKESGKGLERLELINFTISVDELGEYCTKLQTLTLQDIEFRSLKVSNTCSTRRQYFSYLQELVLESINFACDDVMKAVCFIVSASLQLEVLALPFSTSFTIDIVDKLLQSPCMVNLRYIDVSFSDINAAAASKLLLATPRLEKFMIEHISISDSEYADLLLASVPQYHPIAIVWRNGSSYFSDDDDIFYDFEDYHCHRGFVGYVGYDSDDYDSYEDEYNNDYNTQDIYYPYFAEDA